MCSRRADGDGRNQSIQQNQHETDIKPTWRQLRDLREDVDVTALRVTAKKTTTKNSEEKDQTKNKLSETHT
jgi:hypothetical protein